MRKLKAITAVLLTAFATASPCVWSMDDDDNLEMPEVFRLPRPGTVPKRQAETPPAVTNESESDDANLLTLNAARDFMVSLINKDRQSQNLPPVVLDEIASRAGQGHTDEMVVNGYHGHWGLDGKKPNQRYTEGGGRDYVAENAYFFGFSDRGDYKLEEEPRFAKAVLAHAEEEFMDEKPPMDGHRKNILNPTHNRVGICLSRANLTGQEYRVAMTEEFVDHYAEMQEMAPAAAPGATVHVAGKTAPGFAFYNITLYQEPLPKPMTVEEVNKTYSYDFPEKVDLFWPPMYGRQSVINITRTQQGDEFSADIPLPRDVGKGVLYSVGVWLTPMAQKAPMLVSMRTVEVRKQH